MGQLQDAAPTRDDVWYTIEAVWLVMVRVSGCSVVLWGCYYCIIDSYLRTFHGGYRLI